MMILRVRENVSVFMDAVEVGLVYFEDWLFAPTT